MTNRHLTEKEIAKAKMLREVEGLTFKALGERFGVSGSTIQLILKERKRKSQDENVEEVVGKDEIRA